MDTKPLTEEAKSEAAAPVQYPDYTTVRQRLSEYRRQYPRQPLPRPRAGLRDHALTTRVLRWMAPWHRQDYPGTRAFAVALLGGRWAWVTIRSWARGARMPSAAARFLARWIEGRCREGLLLVEELDAVAAESEVIERRTAERRCRNLGIGKARARGHSEVERSSSSGGK